MSGLGALFGCRKGPGRLNWETLMSHHLFVHVEIGKSLLIHLKTLLIYRNLSICEVVQIRVFCNKRHRLVNIVQSNLLHSKLQKFIKPGCSLHF